VSASLEDTLSKVVSASDSLEENLLVAAPGSPELEKTLIKVVSAPDSLEGNLPKVVHASMVPRVAGRMFVLCAVLVVVVVCAVKAHHHA
jgi:hypothetical protein